MSMTAIAKALLELVVSGRRGMVWDIARAAAIEALGILLIVTSPYTLKILIDGLTKGPDDGGTTFVVILIFVLSTAGASVTGTWRMVYTTRLIDTLAQAIIRRALTVALPTIARSKTSETGKVMGILERLSYSLNVVVDGLVWHAVPLCVQTLLCLAVLGGLISASYLVILAVTLAGYLLVTWLGSGHHLRAASASNMSALSASQSLADVLRNAKRAVFNGAADIEVESIGRCLNSRKYANSAVMWSLTGLSGLQFVTVACGLLALLVLGCNDVALARMTVGDFVLLQAYALRLALPLSGFGFNLSQASVAIANISDALDLAKSPARTAISMAAPSKGPAAFHLKSLSFRYGPGLPGIADVTAEIVGGAFIAIVGSNGSGKSTLAQLLAGILEPDAGEVKINGADLANIEPGERFRSVLYVPQFIGLFNRTLEENALYPPTALTKHALEDLLAEWRFYEAGTDLDVRRSVGEQGERLSGGQIQKLELARLAGINVPAVILDESTSALDPHSEARIISSLRKRFGHRTTLILITHEERMAMAADEVLFMAEGRLAGQGEHAELLSTAPGYAELWA